MARVKKHSISRYDLLWESLFRTAVEIGVHHGYFSYYLLKHHKLDLLWSVDPYKGRNSHPFPDAESLLSEFGSRSELLRMTSREAYELSLHRRRMFDFIYIDGDHKRASVEEDIDMWWGRVNPGGMLAGHDYIESRSSGVVEAVHQFADRQNEVIHLTREPRLASWWIWKPVA
jgi:predicted O-methyltransferase YrrM